MTQPAGTSTAALPVSAQVSLRQLHALVAIVQHGSFSRAAKALGMSQSALSQAVQQLEQHVGVKLLDRSTRDVRLSRIGQDVLPGIQRALEDLERQLAGLRDLRQHKRGRVAVACLPSAALRFMPTILAGFKRAYPHIDVSLKELPLSAIRDAVMTGQAELGIANIAPEDPDLHATLLTVDRFALVMRRDHPFASMTSVRWQDAAQADLVAMGSGTGIRAEIVRGLRQQTFEIITHYEAEHPATITALVEAGLGVAPLPGLAWPQPDHPTLTYRPLTEPQVERNLYLVKRPSQDLSPAGQALFRHTVTHMREALGN